MLPRRDGLFGGHQFGSPDGHLNGHVPLLIHKTAKGLLKSGDREPAHGVEHGVDPVIVNCRVIRHAPHRVTHDKPFFFGEAAVGFADLVKHAQHVP